MDTTRHLLVVFIVCSAGCGGAMLPTTPPPVPVLHQIGGVVREVSPTEDVVVRDAVVRIEDAGPDSGRSVVTNDAGGFGFAGLTAERATIRISGRGYDELVVPVSTTGNAPLDLRLAPARGVVNEQFSGNVCQRSVVTRRFVPRTNGFFRLTSIRTETFEGFHVAMTADGSTLASVMQIGTEYPLRAGVTHEITVDADLLTCPRGTFRITYLRPD